MTINQGLYPWFNQAWSEINLDNMPHAMIIHGQTGIGKFDFALHLAKALLCESTLSNQEPKKPCCQCEACHWFDTGNHPDFLGIVPEDHASSLPHLAMEGADGSEDKPRKSKKKADDEAEKTDKKLSSFIKVDQVREALEGINTTPHRGGNRVVLLNPIETLQAVSANTLLKTLEEPPESTLFILVSDQLDRVLPTIRSRCRMLALPRPQTDEALAWMRQELLAAGVKVDDRLLEQKLSQSGGAVLDARDELLGGGEEGSGGALDLLLQALSNGQQINWLGTAESTFKVPMPDLLVTFERWVADLLSIQQTGQLRLYPTRKNDLERCAKSARPNKLADFWKVLLDARRVELHALAQRVQIESLLIRYQEIYKD